MRYLTIIFLVLLVGCKATKETSETRVETTSSSISYVLPILNELEINNLCDSITGKPIDFKSKIKTGTGDIGLESKNNKLKFIYKTDTITKDSIVIKEVFVDKYKLDIVYRTPKIWWYILGLLILCFVFPIIPKFVNGLVRKFIGLF